MQASQSILNAARNLGLLYAIVVLTSCSNTSSSVSLESLRNQEQLQASSTGTFNTFPDVLDPAATTPIAPDDPRAWLELDAAMLMLGEPLIPNPIATRTTTPTEQEQIQAMRLYAEGKSLRASGDSEQAAQILGQCVNLDPQFAEPWRELAIAHRESGDRLAATAAFRNVLAREPDDPVSLSFVGIDTLSRRDYAAAASYLARAWQLRDSFDVPALELIVAIHLGNALGQLGYLTAALNVYDATTLQQRIAPPQYLDYEFTAVVNSQADRWRDMGDIALRLKRFNDASAAYARAATLPSFNPDSLLARRITALVMQGQPASAATLLLDAQHASLGKTTPTRLALTQYLANTTSLASAMRSELDAMEASLAPQDLASADTDILLTRTALLSDSQARQTLREHLLAHPYNERISSALFQLLNKTSSSTALRETLSLIEHAPFRQRTYTVALLDVSPDIDAHLQSLLPVTRYTVGRTLLVTQLLLRRGRDDEAATILTSSIEKLGPEPALLTAQTELALRRGSTQDALQALNTIEGNSRDALLARAWINRALGNYDTAFTIIEPLLSPGAEPQPSPDELLMVVQLCLAREQFDAAEQYLDTIIERYPRFEQAHAERITLYGPTGALRNQDRFADAIRTLRRIAPSSRTIRWLRAQELVAGGQYNNAERELLSLASERLNKPVTNLLVTLWLRTGSADQAETWLQEQRAQAPAEPHFVEQLARVFVVTERAQEAAELLQTWLDARPGDIAISRQLESLYRSELEDNQRADELALRRLKRAPDTPQRALELAGLHLDKREYAAALRTLNELLTKQPTLTAAQTQVLHKEAIALANAAYKKIYDAPQHVVSFLDALSQHIQNTPEELLAIHIMLLLETQADAQTILVILRKANTTNPALASRLYDEAAVLVFNQGRLQDAMKISSHGVETIEAPSRSLLSILLQSSQQLFNLDAALVAIQSAHKQGLSKDFITLDQRNVNITIDDQATAQLVYTFAGWFSLFGHTQESHTLYRLSLQYNSAHVMANNNLGYSLADENISLDEAHRLILTAYNLDATQGSIIDSLGWVRYKLGMLSDTNNDQGDVERQGALTLLTRASTMESTRDDPVVQDHLGDTLWALGQHDKAVTHWTNAASFIDTLPEFNPDTADPADLRIRQDQLTLRETLKNKLDAVENSNNPPVAPYSRTHAENPGF